MATPNFAYLDAAATAPLRPEARDAMIAVLSMDAANPSSVHSAGFRAKTIVDESRERIAAAFGANASEIVFTSGGTEANNLGVIGIALANQRGRHIVTSSIEHPAVAESCDYLERVHGFEVAHVAVDGDALIDPDRAIRQLKADTTLVSIGLANGEVGTVQPITTVAEAAKQVGALVHTDAVQAAASLPVSFCRGGWPGDLVDAMSIASHKFGGPQGAGALLLRAGTAVQPILHGGGQEFGLRSGTQNVAAIAGFAAAVEASMRQVGTRAQALVDSRDELIRRVLAMVPGAQLTGHPSERLPGHASFVVQGVSGESMLVALDVAGVAASSGSACAAGKDEPSPVLLAMGIDPGLSQTAIRFTLHEPLETSLLERLVEVMAAEVNTANAKRGDTPVPGHS